MFEIDGSLGEGGGQILRTSLSLAAVTGQSVAVTNIRAGRDKPGLRPQHLTGALAVARICRAELEGAEVGSTKLIFRPRAIRGGDYEFDVSRVRASAGSVNLILQTIIWPLAFAGKKSSVVIRGGTHVPHAPTCNYISETFLPTVARMGLACRLEMAKAGYYPAGGGEVRFEISAVEELQPISIRKPVEPVAVEMTSAVSNLSLEIGERQLAVGNERLRRLPVASGAGGFDSGVSRNNNHDVKQYPSPGRGTVFFISYSAGEARAGFQSLGAIGKRAEKVAAEACDEFEAYLATGMALDKHLADQLVIPMALAPEVSEFTTCEVTQHLLTNIAIVEKFLAVRFSVGAGLGEPGTVEKREA